MSESRRSFQLRASLLVASLVGAAGLCLSPRVPPTARAADWPVWLGPYQDGTSPETGWLKEWPEGGPPRLFEVAIGEGYSQVAVSGGHLILYHRRKGELLVDSLDPHSGKRRWRFASPTDYRDRYGYNGGPRSMPVVERTGKRDGEGRVFALGPTGILHALDLARGRKLWERDLQGEFRIEPNFFGVGAAPILAAGNIYVHLGGTETGTGLAFALESATGRVVWKSPTDGGSYAAPRLASVDEVRHLFIFHRGGLSSLDPVNGRERWKFPWRSRTHESVNAATPIVSGDVVFGSAAYRTGSFALRVKGESFDVLWKDAPEAREKTLEAHWCTPILVDGHLYAFGGRHEAEAALACVELSSGKVRWRWPSALGRGSLLYADGHFLALGERGDLALLRLSPEDHKELRWIREVLDWPSWTPPTLAGGILYLRDERKLVALDLRQRPVSSR